VSELTIPVIDISGWSGGEPAVRRAIASSVDDAASTVGFMQITGHGIPGEAATRLAAAMDSFFSLPRADKGRLCPPTPDINRGYSAPRSERLSYSLGVPSPDDLFEAFNVGRQATDLPGLDLPPAIYATNIWPARPAEFRPDVEAWFGHLSALAHLLTTIFATALGLDHDYFRPFTDHSVDVLRMNNYAVPAGAVCLEPGQLGMGPHTDFGIVTILWADPLPGLQVLDDAGEWHDVMPRAEALLVNLGDLLARWTNDRWRSTMHRVLAPIDAAGHPFRRRSAAFFHDGNADAVVASLPTAAGEGRDPYEPISVADHLAAKLGGSRSLRMNPLATREAARLGPITANRGLEDRRHDQSARHLPG
jgi:isopenicillin N synthase-like dioxygenase